MACGRGNDRGSRCQRCEAEAGLPTEREILNEWEAGRTGCKIATPVAVGGTGIEDGLYCLEAFFPALRGGLAFALAAFDFGLSSSSLRPRPGVDLALISMGVGPNLKCLRI